ncbi:FAD-dependent oxidoreductase [Rhizobiales bacterium L72]|uniref:FAD-dependent oxidoreductase n=1 Tax=Propylenella binzhouense TaxID=2555902 RepID=A0A964T0V0_9HYPH|nr:FAD-dependent oxidoreductase [Propylenella binzhouense]
MFDVIVVGGGGSGLAAAIEARAAGREVVLLEKNPALGGSTAWSVGSVSATATPHQIRRGIKDRPEDHWADMAGFNGALDPRDNAELRRILADGMPDTFRWLLGHGVRFFGPMPEPPHKKPRMHNVVPNARSFVTHLEKAARRGGVAVRLEARVVALATENGRVVGADCATPAGPRRYRARGGIVLAAGDFTSDPELKARFMGEQEAKVEGVNATATGDGQKLALPLGARILNGDLALGPELRFVPPARQSLLLKLPPWPVLADFMAWSLDNMPNALLRPFVMSFVTTALAPSPGLFEAGAVLVNAKGERFVEETGRPAFAVPDQPGKVAYILLDDRIARLFSGWPHFVSTAPGVAYAYVADYRRNRPDVFRSAATIAALADRLGMPASALAASIGGYNAGAGDRPGFGGGPYVALGPVRSVFVHAEGGLAVDREHRVLGAEGRPIPGLFAAGSTGQGGLLLRGHGHHLAWAFVSGRRAGRNAAYAAVTGDDPG